MLMTYLELVNKIIEEYKAESNVELLSERLTLLKENINRFKLKSVNRLKVLSYVSTINGDINSETGNNCNYLDMLTKLSKVTGIVGSTEVNLDGTNTEEEKSNEVINDGINEEIKPEPIKSYSKGLHPTKLLKGDVCLLPIGPIRHYCIILAINGSNVYLAQITHSEEFAGFEIKRSRIFQGYITYQIIQCTLHDAMKSFVCTFDSKKEIEEFKTNLTIEFSKNKLI
jgi:hypothetical protein